MSPDTAYIILWALALGLVLWIATQVIKHKGE
jgi:hypothetical protein